MNRGQLQLVFARPRPCRLLGLCLADAVGPGRRHLLKVCEVLLGVDAPAAGVAVAVADGGHRRRHHRALDAAGGRKAQDALGALQRGTNDQLHVAGLIGTNDGGDVGDGVDIAEGLGPAGVVHQVAVGEAQTSEGRVTELGDDGGADFVGALFGADGATHAEAGP